MYTFVHMHIYKQHYTISSKLKVKQLCALFKLYNCNVKPKPPFTPVSPEKSGLFNLWKVQEVI